MKDPPDFTKFPRRFITMSMADKYTAVCFIYDGVQYQDLCKEENPDGTFNYSEKCLSKLPFNLPLLGFDSNRSLNDEQGLIRYNQPEQAEFPDILSAISYYWFEVSLLCLLSAIIFHLAFVFLRRRSSNYSSLFDFYTGRRFFRKSDYRFNNAGPTRNEEGFIIIGKISFNPSEVLGYGSKGTCVFRGCFENSVNCAVKRVVSQYLTLADREVELLRSLQHPNLVRYLATEEDLQFIYISLELAEFTLGRLIEDDRMTEMGLSKKELCRQSALGLQHLHKRNIVHRDIKPHNILISFSESNERKVMISDFGLSKQLSNLDTGHTSSAMRYFDGTQGWMAPEIVNAKISEETLLPNKSADIFSLGCVFYYIVTDGKHPFGQIESRQSNILKNDNVLDKFILGKSELNLPESEVSLASTLIRAMIRPCQEKRPSIDTVLKYPFFWTNADKLRFLQEVSDRIDKEEPSSEICRQVESNKKKIFAFGWKDALCKCVQDDLSASIRRNYNEKSLRHLLRLIRNKRNHHRELPEDVKQSLGDVPDGFMEYFASRFPELLPHVYNAMQSCKDEVILKDFYEQSEDFIFN